MGWQGLLQANYQSFDEFESYCDNYGLHHRLGYDSVMEAWQANPTVQGSVLPSDFRKIK